MNIFKVETSRITTGNKYHTTINEKFKHFTGISIAKYLERLGWKDAIIISDTSIP